MKWIVVNHLTLIRKVKEVALTFSDRNVLHLVAYTKLIHCNYLIITNCKSPNYFEGVFDTLNCAILVIYSTKMIIGRLPMIGHLVHFNACFLQLL